MSYVEQFEKAVTEAGAVAIRIMRGPRGAERLIIQTPGGLITERSLARRSGQRHSARHDFGQGNRCERQKPYIRTRPKPEHSTGAKCGERANPPALAPDGGR